MKNILLLTTILFGVSGFGQEIRIAGSDTLILLAQRLSQQYRRHDADAKISIRGGGAEGVYRQLNSKIELVQDEVESKQAAIPVAVGVQAIAVYVNKKNPINELTISELRSIFLGQITNWRQVGGADRPILLFAGESSTGTLGYFQQAVLHGEEPYPFVGKANPKDLVDAITANPDAIGYSSLRYSPEVKVLGIKLGRVSLPVIPTDESVRKREYPISRYIYWHFGKKPKGKLRQFVQWTLSQEGQTVVESVGFEPLLPIDRNKAMIALGLNTMDPVAEVRH